MLKKIKTILCGFFGVMWISLMCSLLAASHDIGGAEFNGILAFLFWIMLFYIIIKNHVLLAVILSTAVTAGISISKFGWGKLPYIAEKVGSAVVVFLILFMVYKLAFSERLDESGSGERYRKDTTTIRKNYHENNSYEDWYDYADTYNHKNSYNYTAKSEPRLINGSDEYWAYRDSAEQIYIAFCEARTVDQRRYYKKQGEKLKTRLFIEYGYNDESVKSICERFLDLRV